MNFLFLTILFPVLGFVILVCFSRLLPKFVISSIGIGSIALSTLITFVITVDFVNHPNLTNNPFFCIQKLFIWISAVDFYVPISFRVDGLSLNMLVMITLVGLLIHIYASWYMFADISYSRFFAYMNLFVANMIILVLADNLLLMYLGWEGVGLCSYLLIGFYYKRLKSVEAALKAFIMTRIGDVFLICAIFMLYKTFHTLDFGVLLAISSKECFNGFQNFITLFLLIAAIAKSAQFPLQTWLSDAMEAPSPVSALIHAATMVTAGVYLIARMHNLFIMTPDVLYLVGVVGSITLIISSCSALAQSDIKRILAYSTMGQIGYMFIALSIQAWEIAVFHLMMHAFFKALLFLASGSLILVCSGEQNIFKMRGLSYKSIPLIYFIFLVGGASLSAVPIITSGFYSKGAILANTMFSGHYLFMLVGLFGSFLTALYTFRMIFVVFHKKCDVSTCKFCFTSFFHDFPLLVLLILSTMFGTWIRIPTFNVFPVMMRLNDFNEYCFEFFVSIVVVSGIYLSVVYYLSSYHVCINKLLDCLVGKFFFRCWFFGWGFDRMYEKIFIIPYLFIVRLISFDPIGVIFQNFFIFIVNFLSNKLVLTENGQLRYYVISMISGLIVIFLTLLIFL